MKKLLLCTAALLLVAGSAFAGGIELSANACPDNAGATPTGQVDCVGGGTLSILGTWTPNEAISDLSNLDGTLGLATVTPLTGTFWDWDPSSACSPVLGSNHLRPGTGCTSPAYTNTWNITGAGSAAGAANLSPNSEKIAFTCFRPSPLSVTAGQRLFGVSINVDGSQATEAGGTCAGCTMGVCLVWNEGRPGSFGASTPTNLEGPDPTVGAGQGITNIFTINGAAPGACGPVPTRHQTWGQLKQLYR